MTGRMSNPGKARAEKKIKIKTTLELFKVPKHLLQKQIKKLELQMELRFTLDDFIPNKTK